MRQINFHLCYFRWIFQYFQIDYSFLEKKCTLYIFIALQIFLLFSVPGEGDGRPSSILAWKIPWTERPGGLQSMGLQRVGHDWAHTHIAFCNVRNYHVGIEIKLCATFLYYMFLIKKHKNYLLILYMYTFSFLLEYRLNEDKEIDFYQFIPNF